MKCEKICENEWILLGFPLLISECTLESHSHDNEWVFGANKTVDIDNNEVCGSG